MSYAARRRPVPPVHRRALGRRPGSSILLPTHHRAAKGAHEGHVREIGVETASLRGPRILEGSYPPVRAATGTLSSCALWPSWDNPRRRRRPLSLPVGPSAGLSRRAIVRLTWQNQGKRDPTPRSRRSARTMITATQCRCARTLLRWSVSKLSSAALVSQSAIHDFELERRQPNAIRPTLFSAPLRMSAWCSSPKTTFNSERRVA